MKKLEADLCIVGGGMSGVCAALAAARNGSRVVLIQDRSVLGGNASSEIRMHMLGASCSGRRPYARESGIIDEIRVEDAVRNPQRSPALFDLLLYDKVVSEPNITLLLDTDFVGCDTEGGRILRAYAVRNLTEDRFAIEADLFADCSGDGRLGTEAGAAFRMGREAASEYGESFAPPTADARTLGSTILFMARKHDRPMPFQPPAWARKFTETDLKLRSHREWGYGYWWAEWGGELDTIKDNERIRHELLRIALGIWDHIKNGCERPWEDPTVQYDKWMEKSPDWSDGSPANWALDWVGAIPGKRESRRFLGPVVLTQADVLEARLFDDQVAYGGWWIDFHPPAGVDAREEYPCDQVEFPYVYTVPLRCLYSRNIDNLLFAGRNISASHVAFASTRVMATCSIIGQAAGTAAAMARRHGIRRCAELSAPDVVREIQQALLLDDCFLPGVVNVDTSDKARAARARASTEHPRSPACSVLNGVSRATLASLHPALPDSTNLWESERLPAWIELHWPAPQRIAEVHLTFDTGFHRELTLTMHDGLNAKMIRGPQPETVRDYTLSTGAGEPLIEVRGNYLRKRTHRLAQPVYSDRLRLDVTAANGIDTARVFEIRTY